jgi:tetratricopeptide (TPR) repeat protein
MPETNREEIAKLEALYASNPEGRVFTHLAEAYRKGGNYDRARMILEQGLLKHPAYASAHVVLGRVLMDLDLMEEAAESFRRVLQLDPHNLVALRSLGDLARAAGRNVEAMGYFEELRHQDPSNEELAVIINELLASPDMHLAIPAEPLPELPPGDTPRRAEPEPVRAEPITEQMSPEQAAAQAAGLASLEADFAPPDADQEALPGDLADLAALGAIPQEEYGAIKLEEPPADIPLELPEDTDASLEPKPEERFSEIDYSEFAAAVEPSFESEPTLDTALGIETEPTFETEPAFEAPILEQPSSLAAEPSAVSEPEPEPVLDVVPEPEPEVLPEPEPEITAASDEPSPSFVEPPVAETPRLRGEVVTETMAELYRSQGLYERAAEVYRAMLHQRPDDWQMRIKLEEVEALGRPAPPAPVDVAPEAPPAFEARVEAPPPFIATAPEAVHEPVIEETTSPAEEETIESPWTSGTVGTTSAPSPYDAWREEARTEVESGPPVSDYFRSLLAWRPAPPAPASFEPAPAIEPEPEMLHLDEPVETALESLFQEPAPPSASGSSPNPMPWEESAAAPPPPPPSGSPTSQGSAFEEWFAADELAPPATSQTAATPPQSDEEAGAETDEDDDLEMFRSWLQSLKK